MKKVVFVVLVLLLMLALAVPVFADPPDCNWGQVTSQAIADGFPQGDHASNQANPRAGLANLDYALNGGARGNLNYTCNLVSP